VRERERGHNGSVANEEQRVFELPRLSGSSRTSNPPPPSSLSRTGHRVKRDDPGAAGRASLSGAVSVWILSPPALHAQRRPEEARRHKGGGVAP
jgi:hypothetical protein